MLQRKPLQVGSNDLKVSEGQVEGQFVTIDGEEFYAIKGVQNMDPFFMSIVSDSDHWMFISSNGALSAGRKNPENALFPYYTVDKIQDSSEYTGNKTIIRAQRNGKVYLWEPFSSRYEGVYNITRNLYKNISGNKIIFEEVNQDILLTYSYQWCNSDKFGFVKKSVLSNLSGNAIEVDLLDGIQNILPASVNRGMQTSMSSLVDAYKKCELVSNTGLGIYMLSSIPVDRAEPSESLKVNTVWSVGDNIQKRLVSSLQLATFRQGLVINQEYDIRGKRGAYFVNVVAGIPSHEKQTWYLVAEVNMTASKVAEINSLLSTKNNSLISEINADVEKGTQSLIKIVASADGLQLTNDKASRYRQFSNVMFNVMRGGIFDNGYLVSRTDLIAFASKVNNNIFNTFESWFKALPEWIHYSKLSENAADTGDSGLIRVCLEYMPLTFSRRHGDPSRPWNLFSIETRNEDGSKNLNYQGNWRDIFQNWEALALSYPGFIESMISKFVNASTLDGYNPYRVTRDGFDWEIHDPHDPWSFIGYWGDHQIIYLCKLLEISAKYHPAKLDSFLKKEIFSYANVPYRIKEYKEILQNPYSSIDYDEKLEKIIEHRVKECGSDGKVIWNKNNNVYFVNLSEKLLISMLAKLANFVPEGGIWMNTQRPEWNDANNALAGCGISMVTLYYLRRYTNFCLELYSKSQIEEISISEEIVIFLNLINEALVKNKALLNTGFNNKNRKYLLDLLGTAASEYRKKVYQNGFSEKKQNIKRTELIQFFRITLEYIDQSVKTNKRPDNLYHAYNILTIKNDELEISHLYEMLEGQVSVLASGALSTAEAVEVLESLRKSPMFREDQHSYMLYPDRQLPRFIEKNNIPGALLEKSQLLKKLVSDENIAIVEKDLTGVCHFNGSFSNKFILIEALDKLSKSIYGELVEKEKQLILDIYETMFVHKAFTGRSGTFYSYEGLGCIYWHMNAKLLLGVEEIYSNAVRKNENKQLIDKLQYIYNDVRAGFGMNKTPKQYGAFPTDPYSHTPGHSGAQQPGMTGQVKEDIISRFGELGIYVQDGIISFNPILLRQEEFLSEPSIYNYFDVNGDKKELKLEPQSIVYTYCQVPVIIKKSGKNALKILSKKGTIELNSTSLDVEQSNSIFERSGQVEKIIVEI